MRTAVIVSAARTPVGRFGGGLSSLPAVELGGLVAAEVLRRAGVSGGQVDEVILGQVLQAGCGQNPARQAAIRGGIARETPAWTVNMVCASGLHSVALANRAIVCGDADCVLAGGMENMSMAPYALPTGRYGARMGDTALVDTAVRDGLWDAFNQYHMGVTAENLARQFGVSREEQDRFAVRSQHKAEQALLDNRFAGEILAVEVREKKQVRLVDRDEHPRSGCTLESLAALRPAFAPDGTVTAGNASGLNDGAAALLVMEEARAAELNLTPLARIVATASAGVDPALMGYGPVPATRAALRKAGWSVADLDAVELNEAFAAQALVVQRELDLDPERVNLCGGAIALGHPIGASGARILVTLLSVLARQGGRRGLASLCVGGGQGIAMLVERY